MSGLEAENSKLSEAPRVGLLSRCAVFFLAWVWPLANSQLGWALLEFGRTASEALWQGPSDLSQENMCVCDCTCTHVGEMIKQEVLAWRSWVTE